MAICEIEAPGTHTCHGTNRHFCSTRRPLVQMGRHTGMAGRVGRVRANPPIHRTPPKGGFAPQTAECCGSNEPARSNLTAVHGECVIVRHASPALDGQRRFRTPASYASTVDTSSKNRHPIGGRTAAAHRMDTCRSRRNRFGHFGSDPCLRVQSVRCSRAGPVWDRRPEWVAGPIKTLPFPCWPRHLRSSTSRSECLLPWQPQESSRGGACR